MSRYSPFYIGCMQKRNLLPIFRTDEFRSLLEKHSTRFSFDDGVIRNICPSQEEEVWALNFKRGLLSVFQTSMTNIDLQSQKVLEVINQT